MNKIQIRHRCSKETHKFSIVFILTHFIIFCLFLVFISVSCKTALLGPRDEPPPGTSISIEPPEELATDEYETGIITSVQFHTFISLALQHTRIQLTHTGEGDPIYGTPMRIWISSLPRRKVEILLEGCRGKPQPQKCLEERLGATVRTVRPQYHSYIEWGQALKDAYSDEYEKELHDNILDFPVQEIDLSRKTKIVTGIFTIGTLVITKIRVMVNYIHRTILQSDIHVDFPHFCGHAEKLWIISNLEVCHGRSKRSEDVRPGI